MKVKASIIVMFGDDRKNNDFLNYYFNEIDDIIPKEFYQINRKCRDNLHYGFYNELSKEDIAILDKYQDFYINFLIDKMSEKIHYEFNALYELQIELAKINLLIDKNKR